MDFIPNHTWEPRDQRETIVRRRTKPFAHLLATMISFYSQINSTFSLEDSVALDALSQSGSCVAGPENWCFSVGLGQSVLMHKLQLRCCGDVKFRFPWFRVMFPATKMLRGASSHFPDWPDCFKRLWFFKTAL